MEFKKYHTTGQVVIKALLYWGAQFFIMAIAFVALQQLYATLATELHIQDWQFQFNSLFYDRLVYAFIFGLLAWLIFYILYPFLFFAKIPVCSGLFKFDDRNEVPKPQRSVWTIMAISVVTAIFLYVMAYLVLWISNTQTNQVPIGRLAKTLKSDQNLFLIHLFFSGLLTPLLEEFFYRACISGYMIACIHFYLKTRPNTQFPKESPFQKNSIRFLAILFVISSNLFFGMVHEKTFWFMFMAGCIWTFLYWRWGLLCSIMSHASYNLLILISGRF